MKKVEAIVRPAKLNDIKDALAKYGIKGLTVSEVAGCGAQKGQTGLYRGVQYNITLLPKIKLEIVMADDLVDEVVDIIMTTAYTGQVGDGKVFVSPVEQAYRVRTREQGQSAL